MADPTPSNETTATVVEQIQAANPSVDQEQGLVDRLVVDNGNQMVEFFQPGPGQLIVSTSGRPTDKPVLSQAQAQTMKPSEIYAMLAPDKAIPAAIADAPSPAEAAETEETDAQKSPGQGGVNALATSPQGSPSPDKARARTPGESLNEFSSIQSGLTSGYCGTQWFSDFNGYGCGNTSGADYSWCLTDWYGGASYWVNNGWASYYNLCPEYGSATLYVHGTKGQSSWNVPQNTYRWFTRANWGYACGFLWLGWCHDRFNETGDVINASTTTFNYQGYFLWSN
jgi:hypothetical protein